MGILGHWEIRPFQLTLLELVPSALERTALDNGPTWGALTPRQHHCGVEVGKRIPTPLLKPIESSEIFDLKQPQRRERNRRASRVRASYLPRFLVHHVERHTVGLIVHPSASCDGHVNHKYIYIYTVKGELRVAKFLVSFFSEVHFHPCPIVLGRYGS